MTRLVWLIAVLIVLACVVFAAAQAGGDDDASLDSPAVSRMKAAPAGAAAGQLTAPSAGISTGFLRAAFDSAQALWRQKFDEAGLRYEPANLTFFRTAIDTPCGPADPRTGPFYCPAAHGVFLNTDFFDALGRTFGLSSPFTPGYVTAHEVGHHVQQLLGLHGRVAQANAQEPDGTNARSVRVELQADCYAGIWLHYVARSGQLTDADVADILRAAAVVGDDFQRNRAGAELAPETWTHGSSAQRVHWVSLGKNTGLPADCNTFAPGAP
jgi:predicted metalloprotease